MDEVDAEAESVINDIRDTFRDVQRGLLSLHQAMVAEHATPEALAEAAHLDKDQHWSQILDADLEVAGKAFYVADPLSWRYFMPAFMVWTLRYFRANDLFIVDQTIYAFDLYIYASDVSIREQVRQIQLDQFATLSSSQCKAVCRFLRYMANHGDYADDVAARRALDTYWGQFCAEK